MLQDMNKPLDLSLDLSEDPLPKTPGIASEAMPKATFEEIVARLEAIAAHLENSDVKLEEALALFEEGVRLSKDGGRRLDEAERKLEILLEQDRIEPFDPEACAEKG